MMNNNFNYNPIQKLQILLNNLNEYINQVNSIIIEMNNIFNQINNFPYNQINQNLFQGFNNNNFNANNFIMNLENKQNYKPKLNAVFDVKFCDNEVQKNLALNDKINIIIDCDTSINKLLTMFFERIGQGNNINEVKNKCYFLLNNDNNTKLDFNDPKKIISMLNINLNAGVTPYFNISVRKSI